MVVEICGNGMECVSLCAYISLFVCALCQPVIEPSLHQLDFFFDTFFVEFFMFFFDNAVKMASSMVAHGLENIGRWQRRL